MSDEEALAASIKKWERVVAGGLENGPDDCALCQLYNQDDNICQGCPVAHHTGRLFCLDTPYRDWDDQFQKFGRQPQAIFAARNPVLAQQAAERELEFLKSLRSKTQ